jgi:hypothetical protein
MTACGLLGNRAALENSACHVGDHCHSSLFQLIMGEINSISESYRSHETPSSINGPNPLYGNAEKTTIPTNGYPLKGGDSYIGI